MSRALMVKTSDTRSSVRDEAYASSDFLTPQKHPIGVAAGVELQDLARRPTRQGSVVVTCVDYDADNLLVQAVKDFPEFIEGHRPAWSKVRWVNLRGLGDMNVIRALAEKYELHPLAIEDLLTGQQRPKVDDYPGSGEHPGRLFNEIMKTLTIISTIFVPLTFLAGVYGMNMPIPENQFAWTYPLFWSIAVIVSVAMLRWFKSKGWF